MKLHYRPKNFTGIITDKIAKKQKAYTYMTMTNKNLKFDSIKSCKKPDYFLKKLQFDIDNFLPLNYGRNGVLKSAPDRFAA
jgi:hypothetical protein